jgi:hypothetical protein
MHLDLRLSRALDRVELVTGLGTPSTGRMCVMSLVACLTGEGHTDRPSCASAVVRAFAIPLNDNMPTEVRQRLKAFAPRIIGTNDGLDMARAEILRRALVEEILPRSVRGSGAPRTARFAAPLWRLWAMLGRRRLERQVHWMAEQVEAAGEGGAQLRAVAAAGAAGRLIARCAQDASDPAEAAWYWDTAIGLLDRLCDLCVDRAPAPSRWAERLELTLDGRTSQAAGLLPTAG